MPHVRGTAIDAVKLVVPSAHVDERGELVETYNARDLAAHGIDDVFVQDNASRSFRAGTVRGLHFQVPPRMAAKLVRVVHGAIIDVAVDVRHGSPTFGRHVSAVLTDSNRAQMYVPAGFAHGFCTLVPDTVVVYKMSDHWSPDVDRGVRWDDPMLGIDWPVDPDEAVVSEKDRNWPTLGELPPLFGGTPP